MECSGVQSQAWSVLEGPGRLERGKSELHPSLAEGPRLSLTLVHFPHGVA